MHKSFIITGKKGEGKTTFAAELTHYLGKKYNIDIGGFYSKGYWNNNTRSCFEIVSLDDKKSEILCTKNFNESWIEISGYFFNPEAIKNGERIIAKSIQRKSELILLDEAGKIELNKKVWYNSIRKILAKHKKNLILCVRDIFTKEIIDYFKLTNVSVFNIAEVKPEAAAKQIMYQIYQK